MPTCTHMHIRALHHEQTSAPSMLIKEELLSWGRETANKETELLKSWAQVLLSCLSTFSILHVRTLLAPPLSEGLRGSLGGYPARPPPAEQPNTKRSWEPAKSGTSKEEMGQVLRQAGQWQDWSQSRRLSWAPRTVQPSSGEWLTEVVKGPKRRSVLMAGNLTHCGSMQCPYWA